jgi:hypothetical protein
MWLRDENEIGSNCGQMVRKFSAGTPEYAKAPTKAGAW